jgi:hypothetical protein
LGTFPASCYGSGQERTEAPFWQGKSKRAQIDNHENTELSQLLWTRKLIVYRLNKASQRAPMRAGVVGHKQAKAEAKRQN